MNASLTPNEQLAMGLLLPTIAFMSTLIEQRVIAASALRGKMENMLNRLTEELAPESLADRVRAGALTALTILSEYEIENGDPNPPTTHGPRADWLRAIIEGGRGKPDA